MLIQHKYDTTNTIQKPNVSSASIAEVFGQTLNILSNLVLYSEPCRRHLIQGAIDLGQATSALLGFIPRAWGAHISSRCTGICCSAPCWPMLHTGGCYHQYNIPTSLEKFYGFVCYTNTTVWEEGETSPWMGSALHAMGKSIQGPSMLRRHGVPSIWIGIRFTCYFHPPFYPTLWNQLFYYAICCQVFLAEIQKEPCTAGPYLVQNKCELQNLGSLEPYVPQSSSVAEITSLLLLKHSTDVVNCLQPGEQTPVWTERSWIAIFKEPMPVVKHTLRSAYVGSTPKYIR